MPEPKSSEILENLLSTLIKISGRKTNKGHAIFTMENVLKQLINKYDFLKHVQIKDIRFSEGEDVVSVMGESDINNVNSSEMGKAIYAIIKNFNNSLGKDAGHFFMKEIRNTLDEDYISTMMNMGIDLGLMQLENEVEELEKTILRNKQE